LDANALLSLYRFTPKARSELLAIIRALKSRLFVTHQAALEFHKSRLKVVDSRLNIAAEESSAIAKLLTQVTEKIRSFSTRYR
jgi:hypothetical protein